MNWNKNHTYYRTVIFLLKLNLTKIFTGRITMEKNARLTCEMAAYKILIFLLDKYGDQFLYV